MKKHMCLFLMLIMMLSAAQASAEENEFPEWEYPLSPEIILDRREYLTLTNQSSLLSSDYVPEDLVDITARCAVKGQMRKEANEALSQLFDGAELDGYKLYVKSSYRSYRTQKTMYQTRLEKMGRDDGYVAYPGSSDHQTGLGVDVLNYAWTKKDGMNAQFALTEEAQWMKEHCFEYGFVIRYAEDKEEATGIRFEPWHLRYVGKEAARYMTESNLCLEEFTREWQQYVAKWEQAGGNLKMLVIKRSLPQEVTVVGYGPDGDSDISIYRGEQE